MKKKILSFVLILLVALCGGLFAACGEQNPGENVSLIISSGLDSKLDNATLLNLSDELSLTESEKISLANGMGYDSKISTGDVVTLIVGSTSFGTRDVIINIDGYEEGMGQLINFSSDSSSISFSEVEYLSGGRAKVTITGLSSGTAEVTAKSGQYSKQVTFTVKVLELPTRFTVKTDSVIYLEQNSTITINAEDYVNFYPSTTNMKDLEFYNGSTLLTVNGVTTLTSVVGQANAITSDVNLTIKSTRIDGNENVQTITVKVVDDISEIDLKKSVYTETESGDDVTKSYTEFSDILTVVKNSSKTYKEGTDDEFSISYGIREVYLIVQNDETDLILNAKVYINGVATSIIAVPSDYELITENNYDSSNYGGLISQYIGTQSAYSFHIYKFEFQYTGYDAYDVNFSFGVEGYTYSETKTLSIEFKNASNLVEFRKSTETEEYSNYTIYDSYDGVYGTRFITKTNTGTMAYSLQLVLNEDITNNLTFLTTTGRVKTATNNIITVTNGENFYISGKDNSTRTEPYVLTILVTYTHDGIDFVTSKTVSIYVQRAATLLEFNESSTAPNIAGHSNITGYNFDLNTSGTRIGYIGTYNGETTLSLCLYGYDENDYIIGDATDFTINNSSRIITVAKDSTVNNKINITATGIGSGNFTIILGNNIRATFNFEIVQSVSSINISIPNEDQNDNVFSLKTDYEYNTVVYNNYLIALTNKNIPVNITKTGDIKSLNITCIEDTTNYVTYSNGYLKTSQDFESNKVANVTITYKYIDENGLIQTSTVFADKILLMSITNISNFDLTTSKNSTSFNLYDYSSVGYYSKDLSTVSVYANILPTNLSQIFLGEIEWVTNIDYVVTEDSETTYKLTTNVFEFTYSKTTGTGVLLCNVTNQSLYDDKGNFTGGQIVLTAKIDRGDYGTYTKSIQFNVIKNTQINVIVPSTDEISLDEYSNNYNLYINVFPSTAVNQKLIYKFTPTVGLSSSAVSCELNEDGSLKVILNDTQNVGSGTLRIIAADSYTSATTYTKWIDIAINVSDGSAEYPYQINSSEDIAKMIGTNFSKNYVISSSIALNSTIWDFSSYTLTGNIIGINNASLTGIKIEYASGNYLGLFKELTGSISNIKISGSINVDFSNETITNDMTYIGLLAGLNSGLINNVYVELTSGSVIAHNNYKLSIGGMVGENTGAINTVISSSSTYTRTVYFKNYLNFIDNTAYSDSEATHTLYLGGVAGLNKDGIISRSMSENLIDFNNSYATAEVYINAYYLYYNKDRIISGDEAIGSICGYSKAEGSGKSGLFEVSACGEITAGSYNNLAKSNAYNQTYSSTNNVFYGQFNNVGGLVGNNELMVCSSRIRIITGANYSVVSENNVFTLNNVQYTIDFIQNKITYYENEVEKNIAISNNKFTLNDEEYTIGNLVSNLETKTYVRGKNYVGGAIGLNKGTVSDVRVEVIETKQSGGYRTGLSASLVIGENYVGGIVGNFNNGSVTSSSFISYLQRSYIVESVTYEMISELSNIVENRYFGDVVIIEIGDSSMKFGLLFGNQTVLATANYVVAIANIQFISINTYTVTQPCSTVTGNNYAIYGSFIDQNTLPATEVVLDKVYLSRSLQTPVTGLSALATTEGFTFIYLPPTSIGVELAQDGLEHEMVTEDFDDDLAFYLFYYQSEDPNILKNINNLALNEVLIQNYISSASLSKCLISSNSSIIEIGDNNRFIVKGTGFATITITSPYNIDIDQIIYIYIVNYTNNISTYLSSTKATSEIETGDDATFDATDSTMIYFSFLDKYNVYSFTLPKDIQVLAKVTIGGVDYIVKAGTGINANTKFGLIKVSEDGYQFVVNNQIISDFTSISFIPYIEKEVEGKIYTTYLDSINNKPVINGVDVIGIASDLSLEDQIDFEYTITNTTKSISLSSNEIVSEPYYETSIDVILNSLNNNESLTIKITMIDIETDLIDTSFNLNWIKILAQYGTETFENGTENVRTNSFVISGIDASNNNKLTITFRYEDAYREFLGSKKFIITFITSNNKNVQLSLTYKPQEVLNITTTLYDQISTSDNQYNFTGSFSYIPSDIIIPGQSSLIEFNIIPKYTNYTSVEVINLSTNECYLLFDLFNRTSEQAIAGANNINLGISIDKALTDNGKFYLRALLDDSITDNSTVSIMVILKDENGNTVGTIIKTLYVQHLPGVKLTVDGVSSGNEQTDPLKLARGLSYDLDVWVKGYTAGSLTKNGNTYTDGELVFYVSDPSLVSIVKNSDGTYKLVVTSNEIISRNVFITTYGERTTEEGTERSKETNIYLEIEEFVVKNSAILGDIIEGVIDGVYSSAIGNFYEFEIALNNNILVYDRSSDEITKLVLAFLSSLSTGIVDNDNKISVWSYQDLSKTTTTWAKVISANIAFNTDGTTSGVQYKTSNGVFTLKFNTSTQVFSVVFLKTEDSDNPTFKFKFYADYYYNNGIPTLKTTTLPTTTQVYNLNQTFVFDIYEKTDLRNPYPIYTYEELMDMREGNYYILLEDIPLPSDFTPITTEIGGLDGNNHKIIMSNIDIESSTTNQTLYFGLFVKTTKKTLLENIIIYVNGNIIVNMSKYSSITAGLLVGQNYGQITNCAVEGKNFPIVYFNLAGLSSPTTINNYVGGLVGVNYGNITNSRVEAGISVNGATTTSASYMPANLGGITAVNKADATITSSYVNARIENNTSTLLAKTGGVVAVNELGGSILTTYISGEYQDSARSKFADDLTIIVYSGASAGAFVYENSGEISNCYANIKMITTESSSGFVYINKENGSIKYCYSTSLVNEDAGNSSFIGILVGVVGQEAILNYGTLYECYALEDASYAIYYFTSDYLGYKEGQLIPNTTTFFTDGVLKSDVPRKNGYNAGIGSNRSDDLNGFLKIITVAEFGTKSTFAKFAVSQTSDKSDGVWFWAGSGAERAFERDGEYITFKSDRPELVASNIISAGTKVFNYSDYDEDTGITKYYYIEDSDYVEGTKFNPYVIATTDDIEYMKEGAVNYVIGENYYRIVCDIIYETSTVSSGLYKYSFLGNIEGNGFMIGNYVLDSSEVLASAGFFGTIGTISNQTGSIKNLTFTPRYISLTNASSVGAVAGKGYATTLVNIYVDGFTYSSANTGVVILGKNSVGGVFGMALGNFSFNEVTANISVNSTYRADLNNHAVMLYTDGVNTKISYTGLIAGVLDGYGKLINIYVYGDNVSIAECAGLMFGYVGKNVVAEILTVTSSLKQYIKADVYGGVIAGQNNGTLKTITITDNFNKTSFFISDDYIPVAVGNLVGLMTGGTIEDATVNADLKAQTGVAYVGGAVGLMKAGRLIDVIVNGDLTGGSTIGGLIGQVYNTIETWKVTIVDSYQNGTISSTSGDTTVRIGSIIGYADVLSDNINTVLNYTGTIISNETKNINVLLSETFITDTKTKITNGVYSTKLVNVSNFAYSKNLQIWIGTIINSASSTSIFRGMLYEDYDPLTTLPVRDLQVIYGISTSSDVYVASTLAHLINGR